MCRIDISRLLDQQILAGASFGAQSVPMLIQQLEHTEVDTVFLDFHNVQVATGSFLRESVLGLKDYLRRSENRRPVVLANVNDVIEEELQTMLSSARDAVIVCVLDTEHRASHARVLGALDTKQKAVLDEVVAAGEIDAPTLAARFRDTEPIGTTAWNNRLAALADKGLIREIRRGRSKAYRPIFKEFGHGA